MKPHFIGIGAQKSATSWLFQCLREHPQLALAPAKELHFFSDKVLYQRGMKWYENQFPGNASGRLCGEISTSYLSAPDAPERIHQYVPEVKLIALLRDPSTRAESHIRHLVSTHVLPQGVRLDEAIRTHPEIIENGQYATHLARYRRWFPKEQIFIATYDEVVAHPKELLARIHTFLGVAPHAPLALHKKYNASAFRASPLHNLINRMYFSLKQSSLGRLALALLNKTGVRSATVADAVATFGKGKERGLFTLTEDERAMLGGIYRDEIHALLQEGISFSS